MDSERRATVARCRGSRAGTLRRHARETVYWTLAVVLLIAFCGVRSYGDREQWRAISTLFESRAPAYVDTLAVDGLGADVLSAAPPGSEPSLTTAADRGGL
jgi:hypothetical protein